MLQVGTYKKGDLKHQNHPKLCKIIQVCSVSNKNEVFIGCVTNINTETSKIKDVTNTNNNE